MHKPGDSDLLGGRAPRTANWASFYRQKNPHYQHITYRLQSDWLHVCKAVLLVQTSRVTCLQSNSIGTTSRAFVQTYSNSIGTNGAGFCSNLGARGLFSSPPGFYWVHIDWLAPGQPDGGGESHHFTGNRNPSPGCLPAPAPAAPHNKTYFSASKTNKKNIRHMNYRHW